MIKNLKRAPTPWGDLQFGEDDQDLEVAGQAGALSNTVQGLQQRLERLEQDGQHLPPPPVAPSSLINEAPWNRAALFAETTPRGAVGDAWYELRRRIDIVLEGITPSEKTRGRTAADPADTATLRLLQGGLPPLRWTFSTVTR